MKGACFTLMAVALIESVQCAIDPAEFTTNFWEELSLSELEEATNTFENLKTGKAKNVIMLIGDGMSLATITAGRIRIGQKLGQNGEEYMTSLDSMPHSGIVKTYSVDHQTPDSASTGTAFLTGVKTRSGLLGVNGAATSCDKVHANKVTTSMEYAIAAGKAAGVVTTTRIQHATPASTYAHIHRRSLYSDNKKGPSERNCDDIALQLFKKRRDIQVILGGGRSHMRPIGAMDEEFSSRGERFDRRDLIQEWQDDLGNQSARYVWNKAQFDAVDPQTTDHLMGLFSPYEMQYSLNRDKDKGGEPSLAEMTEKAIKILSKNDKGFFLLIESGMLDKAHHQGRAIYALEEFHELEKALNVARSLTDAEDTLIITTADHGHMFMIGAGGVRGNDVFGLSSSSNNPRKALDGKYYTTIVYGNGPGHAAKSYNKNAPRQSVQRWQSASKYYQQQSAVPLSSETHSAEDVIVYGSGPMSHLLTGVHEQTHIARVVQYAACLGPGNENEPHCIENSGFISGTLIEESLLQREEKDPRLFDESYGGTPEDDV
ncbi:alkaline phosphatase-like isoform X2 [Clavelina lepadiformis]|uniref:alkaline phosphatase-like isoform X2 n=1 Tax=Clavelina lepadiformis TaxID=159417 RepID=UPI0040426C21